MPVARCKFTDVWSCSHGGVKTLCQQGFRGAAGPNVGTDLIDGHIMSYIYHIVFRRPQRRHRPDRRTHAGCGLKPKISIGPNVGTDLIDGHERTRVFARRTLTAPTSAPT